MTSTMTSHDYEQASGVFLVLTDYGWIHLCEACLCAQHQGPYRAVQLASQPGRPCCCEHVNHFEPVGQCRRPTLPSSYYGEY